MSNITGKPTDSPMVVMAICHFDDTNSSGGLDKQARLLAHTLRASGEHVVMLASTRTFSRAGWKVVDGLPIRFFWTYASPQISGRYLPAALLWAAQLLVWGCIHHKRIRVFHAHQLRIQSFVGALLHKFFRVPHIGKSATGGAGADINAIASRKYFGKRGRRFLVRHTDRFIATTASIQDDLLNGGVAQSQITIIPNGLVVPQNIDSGDPQSRARKCLFLGRLAIDKNVLALADAFSQFSRDNPDSPFTLDYVGKGVLEEQLTTRIANCPAITYRGYHASPAAILPEYGFLILPSSAEGLSNAMLETMLYGLVPVVTRVSGCVDHIRQGENGFFLEGTDAANILAGLHDISTISVSEWQKLSDNATRYARNHFDIREVANHYSALYKTLAHI